MATTTAPRTAIAISATNTPVTPSLRRRMPAYYPSGVPGTARTRADDSDEGVDELVARIQVPEEALCPGSVVLPVVAVDVAALRGHFDVEIRVRQAWPFLAFCDNAQAPPRETRLYIDTAFRVGTSSEIFGNGDPDAAVAELLD